MKKVFSSPLSKAELEQQRAEISAQMTPLYKQLKAIDDALEAIKANEHQSTIDALSEKYNVTFAVGEKFLVTPAIQAYAEENRFDEGYYKSWQVGQKATILSIYPEYNQIRAECDTGQTYRQGIGLNEEQRNKQIKLMSLNTPFPIELIAEALRGD